ncbi:MAG: glycosyltransferase, partial [Planctomycetales bacterium]
DLLDGRVVFLGFRDDVAALLPELSLLVHPARQEPLGRVLLEAAAVGLPVAATEVGGTREIFGSDYNDQASGDSALLVPANDPEALRAAILLLASQPETAGRLGRLARRRAEERFDVRVSASKLGEEYARVARGL